jgi:hypothetical protein
MMLTATWNHPADGLWVILHKNLDARDMNTKIGYAHMEKRYHFSRMMDPLPYLFLP